MSVDYYYWFSVVISCSHKIRANRITQRIKKEARRRAIFAGLPGLTIFAAAVLNFCVRDGDRCDHRAIATRLLLSLMILEHWILDWNTLFRSMRSMNI